MLLEEARKSKQNRRRSCNVAKRERPVGGFRVDSDSEALPKSALHTDSILEGVGDFLLTAADRYA